MINIVEVRPLSGYKVWLKFADGVEGEADLSHLVGQGIFSKWNDIAFFNLVRVDSESHTICWPDEIDLCPDVLYSKVTGRKIEDVISMTGQKDKAA